MAPHKNQNYIAVQNDPITLTESFGTGTLKLRRNLYSLIVMLGNDYIENLGSVWPQFSNFPIYMKLKLLNILFGNGDKYIDYFEKQKEIEFQMQRMFEMDEEEISRFLEFAVS